MKDLDRATWERLEPLFEAALEMEPDERTRYVSDVAVRDPELGRRLAALLEADAKSGGLLDSSGGLLAALSRTEVRELADEARDATNDDGLARAGPYRVVRLLGRGGMGAVYLAERDDGHFEQQVALKVVSSHAAREGLHERFLKERQIQAQLAHPHIARLLDGGLTEDGLPYLVMEYVDGRPITEHCRHENASLDDRLALFDEVCGAVAYANQNLVVHRDLKPSNILVTDAAEVKLVDFGIAKLLEPGADGSSATETAFHLFTPRYAAPEQLQGKPVTTATDVYSLGIVLYELLTGVLPFSEDTAPLERLKLILENVPPPPSRVSANIGPDLDAICLKALRAEPFERYPSAEALREDLGHFRAHRPVEARQGTTSYRFRKFVRRNRLQVAAASLVSIAVLLSAFVSTFQARQAQRERDRAVKAEERTRAINDFLVYDMLKAATPEEARGEEVTVKDVLGAASRRVGSSFEGQEELEADVRLALGRSYLSLGEHESAREHVDRAVALRAHALGEASAETLEARSELAEVLLAKGDYAAAREILEPTLEAQRALLGPESLAALVTEGRLAQTLFQEGNYLAAEGAFKQALERLEQTHPQARREGLLLRARLGRVLNLQRKNSEAEAFLRETLSIQRKRLGEEHPDSFATVGLLADSLRRLERAREAIPLVEDALEIQERIYGRGHPQTLTTLNTLATLYAFDDQPQRAAEAFSNLLERSRESLGSEHPRTQSSLVNLAQMTKTLKKHDVAEPLYREALSLSRKIHGDEHETTLRSLRFLARFLRGAGRDSEARTIFQEIVAISERMASREDADATFLNDYAWLLMTYVPEDMRNPVKALPLAERAVALTRRKQPEFLDTLARAYWETGRQDDAITVQREVFTLPDSIPSGDAEETMIEYLETKESPQLVEQFLLDNLARRRSARDSADPVIAQTFRRLALHYRKHGRYDEAASRLREAIAVYRQRQPESHRVVARAESELGEVLVELGRYEESEALLKKSYENLQTHQDLLPAARERLAKLYRAWGRTPPADLR